MLQSVSLYMREFDILHIDLAPDILYLNKDTVKHISFGMGFMHCYDGAKAH
jgi:tRNA A-37 threonylcarbamoyl transferase component Bud32